ncbi:MAG: hypothetical protein AAFV43_16560 [Planctomycetota bacterium]
MAQHAEGLSGFLVVARFGRDDLPQALFETREAAVRHADSLTDDSIANTLGADGVGRSEYCDLAIIEFSDGQPVISAPLFAASV